MATESKMTHLQKKKPQQTVLTACALDGAMSYHELDNAVFVKDKAYLNFENVKFVQLETGFVCKLKEDAAMSNRDEVAIPEYLRVRCYSDKFEVRIHFGDNTTLTVVDPDAGPRAWAIRVDVSAPRAKDRVVLNETDVVESIHRYFSGHILTKNAVLGVIVRDQELRVQVTGIESTNPTEHLELAFIGLSTNIHVSGAPGIHGVVICKEAPLANDAETKEVPKVNSVEFTTNKIIVSSDDETPKPTANGTETKTKPKVDVSESKTDDAAKTSEILTSEAMRIFHAYMSIVQYELEFEDLKTREAVHAANKILELRLAQIAKEMERRST